MIRWPTGLRFEALGLLDAMNFPLGFLDALGPTEMIFLGAIALLLFGERLPEVARSFGKKFNEFRSNVQSIQEEIRSAALSATSEISSALDVQGAPSEASGSGSAGAKRRRSRGSDELFEEATAPKFVPPKSDPPDA